MPEVVVVEDEEGALPVQVPGGGGRAGRGLELPGEEVAAEEEEGDGGGQVEPAEGPSMVSQTNFLTPSPLFTVLFTHPIVAFWPTPLSLKCVTSFMDGP